MSDEQDKTLVRECLNGKTKAFGTLIDKYQKPLFNAALRIVGDYDEAKDVAQTVFLKAFERLDTYNSGYKFFSWIYRMAVNEAINTVNQRKPMTNLDPRLRSAEPTPDKRFEQVETSRQVEDAVSELKLDYRVVIVLRHFIQLPLKDIAFILEIPEKTVKSRLFTARQRLGGILERRGIRAHD
jgi:RNA polymerase sigma-70 factor (ECF subfamily)